MVRILADCPALTVTVKSSQDTCFLLRSFCGSVRLALHNKAKHQKQAVFLAVLAFTLDTKFSLENNLRNSFHRMPGHFSRLQLVRQEFTVFVPGMGLKLFLKTNLKVLSLTMHYLAVYEVSWLISLQKGTKAFRQRQP